MTFRLVAPGSGAPRPLVVGYMVTEQLDDELRAAIPSACIAAYEEADGELLADTVRRAHEVVGVDAFGSIVLLGFSAGCLRGIRQRLLQGAQPDAVVAIDGIHSSMPPERWQFDVWRDLVADATVGHRLFVATCTQLRYVESLPPGDRYTSTVNTLRAVTGWPIREAGPLPVGAASGLGDCHIHSYASGPADSDAHAAQLRVVLPAMLRRYVAPWLARTPRKPTPAPATLPTGGLRLLRRGGGGDDVEEWQRRLHELGFDPGTPDGSFGPVTDAATRAFQRAATIQQDGIVGPETRGAAAMWRAPTDRSTITGESKLGLTLLEEASADLRAGVREVWGPNDGPTIRAYWDGTGAAPPAPWCAAAVRFWLLAAAVSLRMQAPIAGSVGAKATAMQLQRAGRWFAAAELRQHPEKLRPGMIPVWHRGAPGARTGHIGVCSRAGGMHFRSIEGNSGVGSSQVAEMHHHLGEPHLLGAGWID